MTSLIQITDTHILHPGTLLYGHTDTAANLRAVIAQINRMLPRPELVMITGDLVENPDIISYQHFIELIKPLAMPVRVIPGNHDDPQLMLEVFADTPYFPATDASFQYVIEDLPFRVIALNSHSDGTELPELGGLRLSWLQNQLNQSDRPVLIAIHHPPMITGIVFMDMAGSEWFQAFKSIVNEHPQVKLIICGHCHTDLIGRLGQVPVYMAPATAHQLIADRGVDIAPSTMNAAAPPVLHQFIDGDFLSGSYAWPDGVEDERIDKTSGLSWSELKKSMKGSRA
jgi:Icc protein